MIKEIHNPSKMKEGIINSSIRLNFTQQSLLLKKAYGLRLSKMSRNPDEKKEIEMSRLTTKALYLPKFNDSSNIITAYQIESLWEMLPSRYKLHDPVLVYSTSKDGFSLNTLLKKAEEFWEESAFIIVKTDRGDIFGGFTDSMFRISSEYYGSNDCFVFTFHPEEKLYKVEESSTGGHVFASVDYLLMGSGGKGPSLQVDCDINCGLSFESESFCNSRLNTRDNSNDFQVNDLEVYYLKA